MKKSNLKYIFYILFLGTIFILYQWNKTFFESSDYSVKKGGNKSGASNSLSYSSGTSGTSGLNFQNGDSNEDSGGESESTSSPSSPSSGFSSSIGGSSFETQSAPNSIGEDVEVGDNSSAGNISNSAGANNSAVGLGGGGGMSIGIPMVALIASDDESKEEKTNKQQQAASNNSQTAGRGKFFSGTVETPMAPGPPDEDIPLDGGASILLVMGSMLGVKKLFGKKNIS